MIKFLLNGEKRMFKGDPELPLLKYLREREEITSVKNGCSPQGTCGACTVQLDNKSVLSCATPMRKADGKSVITMEGISKYILRTLVNAFIMKGAVQCGFCTPGIISRTKVLLENIPNPTEKDITKTLHPHLCRCTGYKKIIEAIRYAAKTIRENREIEHSEIAGKIGTSLPKYNSSKTALGQQLFVDDLTFPQMQFIAMKFSDYPRAKVIKIDTQKAEKLEGVTRIFTAKDIPGNRYMGLIKPDWPLMVDEGEITHYVGDVLASVVAVSEEIARQAVSLIHVEYEVLSPIADMHEALNRNSPKVHEGGNLLETCILRRSESAETSIINSDFVINKIYQTQRVEHAYLETEASIARMSEDGTIEIYSQGQGAYEDQRQIADLLGVSKERVNVISVPTGGAFGGKEDLTVQGHAALTAYLLKIPVKAVLNREESIRMSPKRHPFWMNYSVGCDRNGKLTVLKAEILGDTGAYASVGTKVLERAAGHSTGAYHFPAVDVVAKTVYTNNPPSGAMRGFGVNQVTFALESCIDELCEKGGFDRWQFRYDNALISGSQTATGQILKEGVGIRETLLAVKDEFYGEKFTGLACGFKNTGVGNGVLDECKVKIFIKAEDDVILYHGWTEMGQGVNTIAVQILHEETGINPEIVDVRVESRVSEAHTEMTTASRATSLVGNAIIDASKQLKKDLKRKQLKDLAGKSYPGKWSFDQTTKPGESGVEKVITHYSYSYATQLVVLNDKGEIDAIYAAHDGGKIINPTLFEGQIEGALHMGLGYALSEECPTENGKLVSTKLKDCQILHAKNIPKIFVKGIEVPDPLGPYGAKGVGEIGAVPTAAAVVNALYQYDGIRRRHLPVNRKK